MKESEGVIMNKRKELTRIPQSIASNFKEMQNTYGRLAPIVTDLMIFLANQQMNSIFNDISFTLDDFCEKMGHSKKELQRKMTEEERKDILGSTIAIYRNRTGEQLLENKFELALWLATQRNLVMSRFNSKGEFIFTGVQIIQAFEIGVDYSTQKSQKKRYLVVLGGMLKDFLLTNYNLIELKDYRSIPNYEGYRDFYLYLSRIIVIVKYKKQKQEESNFIMSVDELCDIFGSKRTRNDDKKKFVTKTLNKIRDLVEYAKFNYEYVNAGHRYKYHVQFDFADETLEYFDEKIKAQFFKALLNEFEAEFTNYYFHALPHMQRAMEFRRMMDEQDIEHKQSRKTFVEWLFNEEDKEVKMQKYKEVFFKIWGVSYDETMGFELE